MVSSIRLEPRYSLLVDEDGTGTARRVEVECSDASTAMQFAQRTLPERVIELFEDGRSLGRMKCTQEGYWIVRPQSSRRSLATPRMVSVD